MLRFCRSARLAAYAVLLRRMCCVALGWWGCLPLGGGTASAAAAWLTPADLSTGGLADDPSMAADSQGDVTAIWLDSDGVHASAQAAVRPLGGGSRKEGCCSGDRAGADAVRAGSC
jgi:hypothetical protein